MKKKWYFLLMAVIMAISGFSQTTLNLTVGNGTATNSYVPSNTYYNYSLSEAIYKQSEIGIDGTINSLSYYATSSDATNRHLIVYMAEKSKASFSSTTDYVALTDLHRVFTGDVSFTENSWTTVNLTTPFQYQDTANLIIVVVDSTGDYTENSSSYQSTTTTDKSCIYFYQDGGYINPSSPTAYYYGTLKNRANIKLNITTTSQYCAAPSNLKTSNISMNGATVSWAGVTGGKYKLEYKPSSDTNWADATIVNNITDTFSVLSSLTQATYYDVRVQNVCSSTSSSSYVIGKFRTDSPHITTFPYNQDFEDSTNTQEWTFTSDVANQGWFIGSATGNTGNSMYISNDNGVTNAYNTSTVNYSYAYINVDFGSASEYDLSFDWKGYGESSSYDYLSVYTLNDTILVPTTGFPNSNDTIGVKLLGKFNMDSTWKHKTISLSGDVYSNTVKKILFVWWNDGGSGYQPPIAVDNVSIVETECVKPTNLSVDNITTTNATIHWSTRGTTATSWTVYYKSSSDASWNQTNVSDILADLGDNLHPSLAYKAFVVADCGSIASDTILFNTSCGVITNLPWVEDFESGSWTAAVAPGNAQAPNCWMNYNGGVSGYSSYNWERTTYSGHSGSSCASFSTGYSSLTSSHNDWLITPQITLTGNQRFSFYASNSDDENADNLSVWISYPDSTISAPATVNDTLRAFHKIYTATIPAGDAWTKFEIPLTDYTGTYNIAIVKTTLPSGDYNNLYVDDISVSDMPSCRKVSNVVVNNITETEAQVTWTKGDESDSQWKIYCISSTTGDTTITTVMDTTYTLTSLTTSSQYSVYVTTDCGGVESELPTQGNVSFYTQCGNVSAFTQGFETGFLPNVVSPSNTQAPLCWLNFDGGYTSSYGGYKWEISTSTKHSGNNSAILSNYSNNSSDWLVTPILTLDGTQSISFWAKGYSGYNPKLAVKIYDVTTNGDIASINDTTMFTTLMPATSVNNANVTFHKYEINLSQYTTGNYRIAFVAQGNSNNLYLDDIVLGPKSTCPDVYGLTANAATTTSISTTVSTLNTNNEGGYVFYYGQDSSLTTKDSIVVVSDANLPAIIPNLTAGSTYYVTAKRACGAISLDTIKVILPSIAYLIPYNQDFEDSLSAAQQYTFSSNLTTQGWFIGSATGNTGNSMYISKDNGATNTYNMGASNYSYASIPIEFGDSYGYKLSFDWKANGEGSWDNVRVYILPLSTVIPTNDLPAVNPLGGDYMASSSTWQHKSYTLSASKYANTIQKLVFVWKNDGGGGSNPPAAIDNISFVGISCPAVENTSVSSITTTNATISWQEKGGATSWWLYYRPLGATNYDSIASTATTKDFGDSLLSGTTYQYYVKANCVDSLSAPTNISTFTTKCQTITSLPFTANFDNNQAGSLPNCWLAPVTYSSYPSVVAYSANSGTNSLVFASQSNSKPIYAVLPQIAVNTHDMRISFWGKAEYSGYPGKIEIGVMSDANDTSTFELVSSFVPTNEDYTQYTVGFGTTTLTGTTNYIAFRYRNSQYYYTYNIDDIIVDSLPACSAPQQLQVSNTTATTASLKWSKGHTTDNSWTIYYRDVNATTWDSLVVSADTNTIPNLLASHNYVCYVKTNCSGESASNQVYFATSCGEITSVPYVETFDYYGSKSYPTCWSKLSNDEDPYLTNYNSYSDKSLEMSTSSSYGTLYSYVITPAISTTIPINSLMVRFRAKVSTDSIPVEVGIMTNTTDTATFTNVGIVYPTQTAYNEYEVSLAGYQGTGNYVAIRVINQGDYEDTYIDNVIIKTIPACVRPISNSLAVAGVTSTSASVSFNDTVLNHILWNIYYRPYGTTTYSHLTVGAMTDTITGLTPNTLYEVYVTASCGSSTESEETDPVSFRTLQIPATAPYTTAFNTTNDNSSWTLLSNVATNRWIIGTNVNNSTDATSGALYVTNNTSGTYGASATQCFLYAYRDITFGNAEANYTLTFDYKTSGSINGTSVYSGLAVFVVNTNDSIPSNSLPAFVNNESNRLALLYGQNEWKKDTVYFDAAGTKRLLFLTWGYNSTGATAVPAAIDNINIAAPTCQRPMSLVANNLTTTTAHLSWVGTASAYKIRYRATTDTVYTYQTVTTNSATLTGLTSPTNYVVSVASICGAGDTSVYSTSVAFKTPCYDAAISTFPYLEGFESGLSCWNQQYVIGTDNWIDTTIYHDSEQTVGIPEGTHMAYIFSQDRGNTTRLVSPVFNITSLISPYLSFKHIQKLWSGDQDSLQVLYRTSDTSSWIKIGSYNGNIATWKLDSVALPSASANYQIAFQGVLTYGYGIGIDDVKVYGLGVVPIVTTGSSTDVSQTSATLSGNVTVGSETITEQGFEWKAVSDANFTALPVTGTTLTATLNTLTPNTQYVYRAYAITESGTYRGYDSTFTTLQGTVVVTDSISTQEASNVEATTATLNGKIERMGSTVSNVTVGFVLSTQNDPELTTAGVINNPVTYTEGMTTFNHITSGLQSATAYFYRAYITNNGTTTYGASKTFTTKSGLLEVDNNRMKVTIYPNPTEGNTTLSIEGLKENAKVIMTDVQGRVVSSQAMTAGQKTLTISRNNLRAGVYYVRVITDNQTRTEKLIIK